MPVAQFVLILVSVLAAAALTVAVAAYAGATLQVPVLGAALALPACAAAWVLLRVLSDRLKSREDDRYDRTPR